MNSAIHGLDVASVAAVHQFFADHLDQLDRTVQGLMQSGQWTGAAAAAYAEEHQVWVAAARELLDGLAEMEQAARTAHASYSDAAAVNLRMTGG